MWPGKLNRIQGNARVSLQFELLFIIPYVLVATYGTVYLYKRGLDATEIGWITTIGLLMQGISSFVSGYVTDRLGRRYALFIFDLLSWTIPFFILIFADHFLYFAIAALFNGLVRIPHTAFSCLLVEDTPQEDRSLVFMVIQFFSLIGGLIAPVGGLLILQFGEITAIRWMYGFALICLTLMFVLRHLKLKESEIGIRKMNETRKIGMQANWQAYQRITRNLLHNRALLIVFAVYSVFMFEMTITNTYLSLYIVEHLHIASQWISIFPAISSVTMLIILLVLVPKISTKYTHQLMIGGFLVSLVGILLYLIAPPSHILILVISTVILAIGRIFTLPYMESVVANVIDDEERAHTLANLWVLVLVVTAPSGVIGGWAYHLNPRLTFVFVAVAFLVCVMGMVFFHQITKKQIADQAI